MGIKHYIRGANAAAFGNPEYIALEANGFVSPYLSRIYLLEDGAIDAAQTTFLDSSPLAAGAAALVASYGGITRKAHGSQVSHPYGMRFETNSSETGQGHVFGASRLTIGALLDNFPWMVARSSMAPNPNFGVLSFWNVDSAGNHNRIGLYDKTDGRTVTNPNGLLLAVDASANLWESWEYKWDRATGNHEFVTLGGSISVTDVDVTTQLDLLVVAEATLQLGLMRYDSGLADVAGDVGLFAVYTGGILTTGQRWHNRNRVAQIMYGRGVTVHNYTPA